MEKKSTIEEKKREGKEKEGERETGGKADKKSERGQNQRLWVGLC